MNFIESLIKEYERNIKEVTGDIPAKIESYCIGSGSYFEVHAYITFKKAYKLYEEMKSNLQCLGKRTDIVKAAGFIKETFHTMESNTGYTSTFMFPISSFEIHNPNDTLYEWTETLKKQKELKDKFEQMFFGNKQK